MFYLMPCQSRLVIAQLRQLTNAAGKKSGRLAMQGRQYPARTTLITVFAQVDTLPGAHCKLPVSDRQTQLAAEQAALEVRG
jgi:hypothetical protein